MRNTFQNVFKLLFVIAGFFFAGPAYADTPIFWGVYGSSAPFGLGFPNGGIPVVIAIFIVVTLIEAIALKKYWGFDYRRALSASFRLNLFSSIIGFFVGSGFAAPCPCAFISVIIILIILLGFSKATAVPLWLFFLSLATMVIGMYAIGWNMAITWPAPKWRLLISPVLPLFLGFGLTLIIEGRISRWVSNDGKRWSGLLKANLWSYVFLAILVPIFGPNPYSGSQQLTSGNIAEMIGKDRNAQRTLAMLHDMRASNSELLGITKHSKPPREYGAYYELEIIWSMFSKTSSYAADPAIGQAIVSDTLQVPTLTPFAKEKLEECSTQLGYLAAARQAIIANDQQALMTVYEKWMAWYKTHDKFSILVSYITPDIAIKMMIENFNSSLELPVGEAASDE